MSTKIGTHPSFGYQLVANISAAEQLTSNDSGKIFMVDQSNPFTINLPKLSTELAGWQCKFVMKTTGGNDIHIMAHGLTSAGGTGDSGATNDGDVVIFKEIATTDNGAATASSQDGVIFKNGATVGDSIDVFTDGTSWYITSFVADAAHTDDIDG